MSTSSRLICECNGFFHEFSSSGICTPRLLLVTLHYPHLIIQLKNILINFCKIYISLWDYCSISKSKTSKVLGVCFVAFITVSRILAVCRHPINVLWCPLLYAAWFVHPLLHSQIGISVWFCALFMCEGPYKWGTLEQMRPLLAGLCGRNIRPSVLIYKEGFSYIWHQERGLVECF